MAIQDDKTLVTKGDLKKFYNKILPYMGGNFAFNKLGTPDYYSTDEKVIGVWIDGKPLYQKTIIKNNVAIAANTTTQIEMSSGASGLELIFAFGAREKSEAIPYSWSTLNLEPSIDTTTGKFMCSAYRNGASFTISELSITYQYTKTADLPDSAINTIGCYDITRPDLWPENKEITFGNGLYGYRWFNGSVTFSDYWHTSTSTENGIKAGDNIISYGGNVRPANTTGSSAINAFFVNNNNTVAFKWDWTGSTVYAEVDAWYTYTK